MLGQPYLHLPGGLNVSYSNTVAGNKNAYHYKSSMADVIITYTPSTGGMHGHAKLTNGVSFTLENCAAAGHVWAEINEDDSEDDEPVYLTAPEGVSGSDYANTNPRRKFAITDDTTTVVTYSIKFYYTLQFAASTPDIPGFINQLG